MMHGPFTIGEAQELGVPECFSEEYAFHERNGTLPPYSGPVEPDWGSDAYDPFGDERPESDYPPAPPPPVSLVKPHRCTGHLCCPPF